jgi:putative spermidine/putrescine transport system permease protein
LVLVVVAAAAYFLVPLWSTARAGFTIPGHGWTLQPLREVTADPKFSSGLWLSFRLAVATTILSLVLMVPTLVWLHLRVPRLRPVAELVSILPFVVPPIAMVAGVTKAFHSFLTGVVTDDWGLVPLYVVLAMPFTYRALDAGLSAIDLHTLSEAAENLGAKGWRILVSVILPNMRTAALGAAFLTIAVVLGEFTIASLLLHQTFPIYLAQVGGSEPQGAPALALLAIALTWALLGIVAAFTRRRRVEPVGLG